MLRSKRACLRAESPGRYLRVARVVLLAGGALAEGARPSARVNPLLRSSSPTHRALPIACCRSVRLLVSGAAGCAACLYRGGLGRRVLGRSTGSDHPCAGLAASARSCRSNPFACRGPGRHCARATLCSVERWPIETMVVAGNFLLQQPIKRGFRRPRRARRSPRRGTGNCGAIRKRAGEARAAAARRGTASGSQCASSSSRSASCGRPTATRTSLTWSAPNVSASAG